LTAVTCPLTIVERRALLESTIQKIDNAPWIALVSQYPDGTQLFSHCEQLGFEGVVSKKRAAPYRAGARSGWLKTKCAAWRAANRDRHLMFQKTR
jgi:bifunctional non-homologous end joining protein LigD